MRYSSPQYEFLVWLIPKTACFSLKCCFRYDSLLVILWRTGFMTIHDDNYAFLSLLQTSYRRTDRRTDGRTDTASYKMKTRKVHRKRGIVTYFVMSADHVCIQCSQPWLERGACGAHRWSEWRVLFSHPLPYSQKRKWCFDARKRATRLDTYTVEPRSKAPA